MLCRVVLAQRVSDHGLHGFDEVSPRVDGPSLIETDRFIGRVNHGVSWLCELRDNGIGHANIAVCVIGSRPASDLGNSTVPRGPPIVGTGPGWIPLTPDDGRNWPRPSVSSRALRSEEHTSELQSLRHLVCRLLL